MADNFSGYPTDQLWGEGFANLRDGAAFFIEIYGRLGNDEFWRQAKIEAKKRGLGVASLRGVMRLGGWHGSDHVSAPRARLTPLQQAARLVDKMTEDEQARLIDYIAAKRGII